MCWPGARCWHDHLPHPVPGQLLLGLCDVGDQLVDGESPALPAENLFPGGGAQLVVALSLLGLKQLEKTTAVW